MQENDSNSFNSNPLEEIAKQLELLKEELEVNKQEQDLLKKQISMLEETFKKFPPQIQNMLSI